MPIGWRKRRILGLILLATCLIGAQGVVAKSSGAPDTLAAKDREAAGGRSVQLVLEQEHIEPSVDIGRTAPTDSFGGLLGALVISSMDDRMKRFTNAAYQRVEAELPPLREVLESLDVASLVREATDEALARLSWLGAQPAAVSRDQSPNERLAFAQTATGGQVAFVSYSYDLSPDCTQIRVFAEIELDRFDERRGTMEPLFRQRVASIAQLDQRSYEIGENIASWSESDGERARSALSGAIAQMTELIPAALELDRGRIAAYTDKNGKKIFAAGLYGNLVERDEDGVTFWSGGLVHVRTIP